MKTQSNNPIEPIQSIGDGKYYIHTNIVCKTKESDMINENPTQYWESDTIRIEFATLEEVTVIAKSISAII